MTDTYQLVAKQHQLDSVTAQRDALAQALRLVLLNLPRSQRDYPETVAARAALAQVRS